MTEPAEQPHEAGGHRFPRVLGVHRGDAPGPTLFVCGGMHGNEPAGAFAAARVLRRLNQARTPFAGEIVAIAGNLKALERGQRFLDVDLNRCWTRERVARLEAEDARGGTAAPPFAEAEEQRAILTELQAAERRARGPIVVLDLHTTSGGGPPFSLMSDTLRNRAIAHAVPVPTVLGLEETIDGTLLEYGTERGHAALAVEGGQHDDPASVDHHAAVVWLILESIGCLDPAHAPPHRECRGVLRDAVRGLPHFVELRGHHRVAPGDQFRMRPGYVGFQAIERGEVLADDRTGEIRAPESGRILMPLYQSQGEDGFFLIRRVRKVWLGLSSVLRRLRAERLLPLLPGVEPVPDRPDALRVDPGVARWYVVELFHLFGFRRRRPEAGRLVFSRRSPD